MPGNFPNLNRETFVSILPRFSTKFSLFSNFVKDFATLLKITEGVSTNFQRFPKIAQGTVLMSTLIV